MNIDEALKYLGSLANVYLLNDDTKYWESIQLGMEALKRIKAQHNSTAFSGKSLLAGES